MGALLGHQCTQCNPWSAFPATYYPSSGPDGELFRSTRRAWEGQVAKWPCTPPILIFVGTKGLTSEQVAKSRPGSKEPFCRWRENLAMLDYFAKWLAK